MLCCSGTLYPRVTRDLTVERTAFLIRASFYIVFALLAGAVNLLFDYTKVRTVVEDRRSVVGAIAAAGRFLVRNRAAVTALYAMNLGIFLLALAAYAIAAPGGGGAGVMTWVAVAVGQLYVLVRLWVKLAFWASGTALFQSRFGHAGYVARPQPKWPDSPAAEAI